MPRLAWLLMIALGPTLAAQVPSDTGARPDRAADQLRDSIRQRWHAHVRSTLGLSDAQAAQLRETEQRYEQQRQPLRARQRAVNQALRAELASGSPNQDRVTQLMNEQQQHRAELQRIDRSEDGEMQGYLTPVQRARYQEERRRFQERVREVVQQRQQQRRLAPTPGPRARPGRRPRP
jgi:Spy/CpxP family protein refolding chaperone